MSQQPNTNSNTKRRPKKRKAKNIILISLAAIIVLSNTPPAQFLLLPSYAYRNGDGSFRYSEEPGKGMDLTTGEIQFDGFKRQHPENPERTLYRTFRIKPWQFWEWWQYIAHPKRFTLPYLKE